jgi:hypothetical protein
MKPWVCLLATYILALSLIPCTWESSGEGDGTCCLHCIPLENDHSSHEYPLNDCSSCNPLSCCNNISFIEHSRFLSINLPISRVIQQIMYIEHFNEAVFISIWQPPKIA